MKPIKHFFIFSFFLLFLPFVSAQKINIKDRFNIKLGYNAANSDIMYFEYNGTTVKSNEIKPHFRLDVASKLSESVDLGFYFGYSGLEHIEPIYDSNGQSTNFFNVKNTNAFYYGLNCDYHLLQLFKQLNKSRFDLYATGKVGLVSESWKNDLGELIQITPFGEYGIGLGLGYNFTKHFGAFGEYVIGNFYNEQKTLLRGGLVFKF